MFNKLKNNFVDKILSLLIVVVAIIIMLFIIYIYAVDSALIFELAIYPAIIIGGIIMIIGMMLVSLLGHGLKYLLTEIMDMNNRLIRIERDLNIKNEKQNSRD